MMDSDEKIQWPPCDGTSQAVRHLPALDPADFPVDGRSIRQLLEFTRDYARQLKYFDTEGHVLGDWDKFLPDDLNLDALEQFIAAPETIMDEHARQEFSRPHFALFLTFLKLLGRAQERMNGFTRRHLDFYYQQVLRMSSKPGEPDQVHVLVELADGEKEYSLPAGTRLAAGKDSRGAELFYRTDRELLANRARVASLRRLFVDYQPGEKLDSAALRHRFEQRRESDGLEAAIRFALGDPEPDDALPSARKFADLEVDKDEEYIREKLFLEPVNFKQVKAALQSTAQLDQAELGKVYSILEQAMRRKRGWRGSEYSTRAWQNLYAAPDATRLRSGAGAGDSASVHWRTFGGLNSRGQDGRADSAAIGFAVSSPLLLLGEGERKITLTLGFEKGNFDGSAIDNAFNKNSKPFRILLSSGEESFQVEDKSDSPQPPEIRFELVLDKQKPAVTAPTAQGGIDSPWPVLQVLLADIVSDDGSTLSKHYRAFRSLVLEKVHLQVQVTGIAGLTLQNDDRVLDAKKPFEPFGTSTVVGSSFYIANAEICTKKLEKLTLAIDWMGVPDDLQDHYLGYAGYNEEGVPQSPVSNNTAFTTILRLHDLSAGFTIDEAPLFRADYDTDGKNMTTGASVPTEITISGARIKEKYPRYGSNLRPGAGSEALDWNRYWQLELSGSDFQHAVYPRAAASGVMRQKNGKPNPYVVNPPYTPKIKRLTVGYLAAVEIDLVEPDPDAVDRLFHIEPFGYREIDKDDAGQRTFLPRYDNQGELYIGLADVRPPQSLSLLFQVADGSANPDLEPPTVQWSYLSGNRWKSLEQGDLNFDGTRGLINSGIVKFNLPTTENNTLLPTELYWIRASAVHNIEGVADTLAITAQAVSATCVDDAANQAGRGLAGNTISELAVPQPELKAIHQPYPSFGGRAPERPRDFHTRVSERLRHKNRALTAWDYERLILERFPTIYKAKCIPAVAPDPPHSAGDATRNAAGTVPGGVRIVVIPDIRNNTLSDPFAPKVPASLLADITAFLRDRMPPSAELSVRNAAFVPVKLRFFVTFKNSAAGDEGYYRRRLNDEINRFLSPWAYDERADIVFGQSIYANDIVNFIDGREYVDYVAQIKLFKGEDNELVPPPEPDDHDGYFVTTDRRDEVLVAARRHEIGITADYEDEIFAGIGYMRIELDFVVA